MDIHLKGLISQTTGKRDHESIASSRQFPAKPRAIQGSVFDGLRLGEAIAPCAVDGYRGFDGQRAKDRAREKRNSKNNEGAELDLLNRLPEREYNLPMIWASDECLDRMASELDKEISPLGLSGALLELAIKRNGLLAILHELELRTPA